MKLFAAVLSVSMLLVPTASFAQQQPPPMLPPPPGNDLSSPMWQMHQQMEKIHQSERTQVLAALTPAHRALVANLVGELAVAQNPDSKAAAAKLDAALSTNEKDAVQSIHESTMKQMHEAMQKMMTQQPPQGGPPQFKQFPERQKPSAGQLVLDIAASGANPHDMIYMAHPGSMRHFHGPATTPNPSST